MNNKENRQQIWNKVQPATLCAVTKNHSIAEVEQLLKDLPELKCIAESRWPDCEEKFKHFTNLERHFIGPLQTNKVRKIVPLVDVIQSVDGIKLLEKIDRAAAEEEKIIKFCFQVNISDDDSKHGIPPHALKGTLSYYKQWAPKNTELIGLMTIGRQASPKERRQYYKELKQLFDQSDLKILSMGMSEDYEIALEEGANMVRLGSILFS